MGLKKLLHILGFLSLGYSGVELYHMIRTYIWINQVGFPSFYTLELIWVSYGLVYLAVLGVTTLCRIVWKDE